VANFYYNGKLYDLKNSESRSKLKTISKFGQSVSLFAEKWFAGPEEFEFYTSGSTGEPKKIIHTRQKLEKSASQTIKFFELSSSQTALLCLDPNKIAGAMMMVRAFIAKMDLYGVEPDNLIQNGKPNFHPCSFGSFVPYQLIKILDANPTGSSLQSFKSILIGGAPLNQSLKKKIINITPICYETFGMTETITHIGLRALNGYHPSGTFQVIGDWTIGLDEKACLQVSSEITDNKILSTTDLVEIFDPKHFVWLGRFDNVINCGGIKFYPEKIEEQIDPIIKAFGSEARFVISSIPDQSLGNKLVLVFEGEPIPNHNDAEILEACKEKLEKYSDPKHIYYLPEFPVTSTGKVLRKKITLILAGLPRP